MTIFKPKFSITYRMTGAITQIERARGFLEVELFFKWIKQHLRIKSFFSIFETAVKTQIWIAISVYVLVAIMKKT